MSLLEARSFRTPASSRTHRWYRMADLSPAPSPWLLGERSNEWLQQLREYYHYRQLPDWLQDELVRYILFGSLPSSGLMAVLAEDPVEALPLLKDDMQWRDGMPMGDTVTAVRWMAHIGNIMCNAMPFDSYGSTESVWTWFCGGGAAKNGAHASPQMPNRLFDTSLPPPRPQTLRGLRSRLRCTTPGGCGCVATTSSTRPWRGFTTVAYTLAATPSS